ncbi:unnamed protein product [Polarella glacialis]|uniref:Uncharacterized protein n=1 Tax=Polarella glacialis TaxID=89957 RepID=A0A813FX57_POLGL|nr:unnamed protein product [Polarella glacialis]
MKQWLGAAGCLAYTSGCRYSTPFSYSAGCFDNLHKPRQVPLTICADCLSRVLIVLMHPPILFELRKGRIRLMLDKCAGRQIELQPNHGGCDCRTRCCKLYSLLSVLLVLFL